MKSENFIEIVLPKVFSVLVLTAMFLSCLVDAKAGIFIFGPDGKIVKRVEVEATLTGNPIGGLTPTGLINSSYFPSSINNLVNDETTINNLNLPAAVTELPYYLNNSAIDRGFLFRNGLNWGGNILSSGVSRRIPVGTSVQFKNGSETVLSGTFTRPIRNYEAYDTAIVGRFTVPVTPVVGDDLGLGIIKFFPAENRLSVDAAVSGLAQSCTQFTLNEGAVGSNGPVVASLATVSGSDTSGFHCSADGNVTLTTSQVASLRSGGLFIVALSASNPNGVRRGQIETSSTDADFTGDGRADIGVFRPSNATWYVQDSNSPQYSAFIFGTNTSKPVAGDYDGDSKTDAAVFEPSTGIWKIRRSSDNAVRECAWGAQTDIALTGKHFSNANDLVVFRSGTWYIKRFGDIIKPIAAGEAPSNNLNFQVFQWGQPGDKPLMADFNGDGRDELTVFRPSTGIWYVYNQINGSYKTVRFGITEDIPVAADYDSDGKADIAVFRPSTGIWYILGSAEQNLISRVFGQTDDIPVVADYDKDGVADIAVFRPSNGTWYRLNSSNNSFAARQFGQSEDVPTVR
jgi:hypothetical protein